MYLYVYITIYKLNNVIYAIVLHNETTTIIMCARHDPHKTNCIYYNIEVYFY